MSQELYIGMEKAPQRAVLKSLGLTDAELDKPLVAIVAAKTELAPGYIHIDRIIDAVKSGICGGGCVPVVLPSISICDAIAAGHGGSRYALPSRELIADGVETMLSAHAFDGAVFVNASDEAGPGMLMGAIRANIPSVFVSCGPSASGIYNGKKVGLSSVIDGIGAVKSGKMSLEELTALETAAYGDGGSGNGMYTTNAFGCMLEAMGMALAGNGTALSSSSARIRIAKDTGAAVCELVRDAITPRMIITKRALLNAITLELSISASPNIALHTLAIAAECNIALTLDDIQKLSDCTPTLCKLIPYGEYDMQDFALAGGVMAVLHELAKANLIDGSAHTVACNALVDGYEHAHVKNTDVISKIDSPIAHNAGLAVIKGNLAEDGALVKRSAVDKAVATMSGKAKCFDCEEDAVNAIYSGKIKSGDVVIIRYEGPIGGPGMREIRAAVTAINGAGLAKSVAVITDGRLTDAAYCTAIGHVSPEAAIDGKLSLIKDGDVIKIDISSGRISLEVPAKELQARQKKLRPKDTNANGWLLRYQNLVTSAANGATFKKKF